MLAQAGDVLFSMVVVASRCVLWEIGFANGEQAASLADRPPS
jgi:hypothetical protein